MYVYCSQEIDEELEEDYEYSDDFEEHSVLVSNNANPTGKGKARNFERVTVSDVEENNLLGSRESLSTESNGAAKSIPTKDFKVSTESASDSVFMLREKDKVLRPMRDNLKLSIIASQVYNSNHCIYF